MTRTFDDWYRREDYGDREQLERCWASGQNAQAIIDMRARSNLARKVLEAVETRQRYFSTRNPHNGWSSNESGPCCKKCELRPEHFTGRADALKAVAGCRNPFQLPEVCQCHTQTRLAATAGIDKALTQILTALRELFAKEGIDVETG